MNSPRPYLLRAIYQWLVDNGLTPHLLVEVNGPEVRVPKQFVENGVIVLNIAASAVRELNLGDEYVEFNARFGGTAHHVSVPLAAVQAIYARENGRGLTLTPFDDEQSPEPGADRAPDAGDKGGDKPPRKPNLTIVR